MSWLIDMEALVQIVWSPLYSTFYQLVVRGSDALVIGTIIMHWVVL